MKDYGFANRLAQFRKDKGFSQFQLAQLMGVSDKAVSKWENGNSKPRTTACTKLASILGVDVDQLMEDDNLSADEADTLLNTQRDILWEKAEKRMKELYGDEPPLWIRNRFIVERNALHRSNAIIMFDILAEVSEAARRKQAGFTAPGTVSFTAWLLGATEVNPLEPHRCCPNCHTVELHPEVRSGWDLPEKFCECGKRMVPDGQDIPVEICVMGGGNSFDFYKCEVDEDFLKEAETIIINYGERYFAMERFHEDTGDDYERTPEGDIVNDPDTGKPVRIHHLPYSSLMFRPKKKVRSRKPDKISGPADLINWGKRTGQPTIALMSGFYDPRYLSEPSLFKSTPDELVRQNVMERALRDYWNYMQPVAEARSNLVFPKLDPYVGRLTFSKYISLLCSVSNLYMISGPEELAEKLNVTDLTDLPLSREELWKLITQSTAYPGYMSGAAGEIMHNTGTGRYLNNQYQHGIGNRERKLFREMNLPEWFEAYASSIMSLCFRSACIEEGIRLLEDARRKIRDGK